MSLPQRQGGRRKRVKSEVVHNFVVIGGGIAGVSCAQELAVFLNKESLPLGIETKIILIL